MLHEDLNRHHTVKESSDRGFGMVFAAFFTIVGLWPLVRAESPRWWALSLAVAFLLNVKMCLNPLLATIGPIVNDKIKTRV